MITRKEVVSDLEFDRDRVGEPGCNVRHRARYLLSALDELDNLRALAVQLAEALDDLYLPSADRDPATDAALDAARKAGLIK